MWGSALLFCCCYFVVAGASVDSVHAALWNDGGLRYSLSWVSDGNDGSFVQFGYAPGSYSQAVKSSIPNRHYDRAGRFDHFALLPPNITQGVPLYYRVGNGQTWSKEYTLRTKAPGFTTSRIWVAADFGVVNSAGTAVAINAIDADLCLHMGDISYANDHPWAYEKTWTTWFGMVEKAITSMPYMVSPGNHEVSCRCLDFPATRDFRVYKARFLMPGSDQTGGPSRGSGDNMWYSFDYGLVHFVSISTETDYPGSPTDLRRGAGNTTQLQWLENDLAAVDRSKTPWLIVLGHRPIYVKVRDHFSGNQPVGVPAHIQAAFEPMFHKYKVDLHLAGHTHQYQRSYPVFNSSVVQRNYNQIGAMVTIIAGGAGSAEGMTHYDPNPPTPDWHAFGYAATEGYGVLDVMSASELRWNYYSSAAGQASKLIDSITITH